MARPAMLLVDLEGFEPLTLRVANAALSQLSYKPEYLPPIIYISSFGYCQVSEVNN